MKDQSISYEDCANALLMMWMENILTDSEYGKIMDRLNANRNKFVNANRNKFDIT